VTFLKSSLRSTPRPPPSRAEIIERTARGTAHRTLALVVRAVPYGESDLVVGLFTESLGQVAAMARRARAPGPRKLHLEPMHTLDVILQERARASLFSLTSAAIVRPRVRLTGQLDRLQAAGSALRWVRQATPLRTPEPDVWGLLQTLLDELDQDRLPAVPSALLVVAGLRLLACLGYGLDLDACVVCGRPCPPDRAAHVDPVRGGLVCRRCGGAGRMLRGAIRQRLHLAIRGEAVLNEEDLPALIELLESALIAHACVKLDRGAGPSSIPGGVR